MIVILCYHPVGYCAEPAVATATASDIMNGFQPLCPKHLDDLQSIAHQIPSLELRIHPLFLPTTTPDPSRRLGD